MHLCASRAFQIIFSACLDEVTGWFRLFQSTREIKARFICFYPFLLWAAWLISNGRLGAALGSWDQVCILGWVLCSLFLFEISGMSLEISDHCAGSWTRGSLGKTCGKGLWPVQSPFVSGYGSQPGHLGSTCVPSIPGQS